MKTTDGLTDAQAMALEYSGTFDAPSPAQLAGVDAECHVKVCRNSERFWVLVTGRSGKKIFGVVCNALLDNPDLPFGAPVCLEERHVYCIVRIEG